MSRVRRAALGAVIAAGAFAAAAQGSAAEAAVEPVVESAAAPEAKSGAGALGAGPETNLPLPRFVSLKSSKANIRRGPGLSYRTDWVFLRRGMPLKVLAEHGHWRKVADVDGDTGWVHHAMLRGDRSAVVVAPRAAFRREPRRAAPLAALAEAGVIVALEACVAEWCEVAADGYEGWVAKAEIWGADPAEVFD